MKAVCSLDVCCSQTQLLLFLFRAKAEEGKWKQLMFTNVKMKLKVLVFSLHKMHEHVSAESDMVNFTQF